MCKPGGIIMVNRWACTHLSRPACTGPPLRCMTYIFSACDLPPSLQNRRWAAPAVLRSDLMHLEGVGTVFGHAAEDYHGVAVAVDAVAQAFIDADFELVVEVLFEWHHQRDDAPE